MVVKVEFDAAKNTANLTKHGFSLGEAADFDFTAAVIDVDDRFDYGETRYRAYARSGNEGRCLVFTIVDADTIRAISYRRARDKELKRRGFRDDRT